MIGAPQRGACGSTNPAVAFECRMPKSAHCEISRLPVSIFPNARVRDMNIDSVSRLEDLLSEPTPAVIETLARVSGDILILGVAGKMGLTLARMARRAADACGSKRRVIGVARFSEPAHETQLRAHEVETIRCDLLDETAVERLPDCPNVIFMAGMKFGSTTSEPLTWAMNSYLPALVARKFARSQIVAFSTGNIYGLVPVRANSCSWPT